MAPARAHYKPAAIFIRAIIHCECWEDEAEGRCRQAR